MQSVKYFMSYPILKLAIFYLAFSLVVLGLAARGAEASGAVVPNMALDGAVYAAGFSRLSHA